MPKLHVPLFGGRGPKKSNTILPRSKDSGNYDQRFLLENKKTFRLFVKESNVTCYRYEAFTRKQGKTELFEQYHCMLTELVVKVNFKCINCNDGGLETEAIWDLFITNMSNDEVQKDLLAPFEQVYSQFSANMHAAPPIAVYSK